jgi:subtilisin-like proprotein convertase family protein
MFKADAFRSQFRPMMDRSRVYRRHRTKRLRLETLESRALLAAEVEVRGNNLVINDGDTGPSPFDFTNVGQTAVEGGALTRSYTIRNLGADLLTLDGAPRIQITGAHAADFTVVAEPSASVAAAESTTFTVRFDPSAAGSRSATISIANNDDDENPFNFAVLGVGLAPTVIAAPDSYNLVEDTAFSTGSTPVVPLRSSWRAFEDMTRTGASSNYPTDGSAGDDWNDRSYNIATPSFGVWKNLSAAPFAAPANGVAGLTAPVTTLNSGFVDSGGGTRVTALFRTHFSLDAAQAAVPSGRVLALCDDGCVGYINGVEVFLLRMPAGPITATTEAAQSSTAEESTYATFDVNFTSLGVPLFADSSNVFAVELHQSDSNSSDIGFDAAFELNNGPAGLVANDDRTAQNGAITVALVTQPVDSISGEPAGTVTLAAGNTGNFTFTPRRDYHGSATFSYRINDASNLPSTAQVTLNVSGVNEPPRAVDDHYAAQTGASITTSVAGAPIIEANDSAWWYQDNGSDQDTLNPSWKGPPSAAFDPAAAGWKGPRLTELGFGDGDEHTVINDAGSTGGLSYYFYRTFDLASLPERIVVDLKRDDGAAVYINGVKVILDNLPAAHPFNVPALQVASDDGGQYQRFEIDAEGLDLQPSGNTIAVEIHQQSAASSDLTFDLRLYDPAFGLLGNDEDLDDVPASLRVVNVTHSIDPATEGTLTVSDDGTFTFTPVNENVYGDFTFTYQVQDDQTPTPAVSVPATVTLTLAVPPGAQMLPDLIAWADQGRGYMHGWTIDRNEIPGRTVLRLSTATPNIGQGPMELRGGAVLPNGQQQEVKQRIQLAGGGFTERLAGTFVYHAAHSHIHWENFAHYYLREVLPGGGVGDIVATGGKTSFCLLDVTAYDLSLPGAPSSGQFGGCQQTQGISIGHADVYDRSLPDQWIDITNVPVGEYWLEVAVDPMDTLLESNEANNTTRILIDLSSTLQPDSYEPNNDFATAADVATGDVNLANLSIHAAGNDDFYRWTSSANGILRITAQFSHSAGNLDLFLYDAAHNLLASSTSLTDTERVNRSISPGQTYYVLVRGVGGDVNSLYSLSIDSPIPSAQIAGHVYSDLDGDGARDAGEPGLPGWRVYVDANNNGVYEPQQTPTVNSTNVPVAIPDSTTVNSNLVVSGVFGPITDIDLALDITHTYDGDLDVFLISPAGTRVELFSDVGDGDENFRNTVLDDEASNAIAAGAAPFAGRYRPEGLLSAFDGQIPTGLWRLEIIDDAGADVGTLNSWSLTFQTGEASVLTDADGRYEMLELPPGAYHFRQVPQTGYEPTAPASGEHSLTLVVDDSRQDIDFGNHSFLTGDLNDDRRVDRLDVALLTAEFGQSGGVSIAAGDLDGDGQIGARDLALLQTHLGRSLPAPSAPAAIVAGNARRAALETARQRLAAVAIRRDTDLATAHDAALSRFGVAGGIEFSARSLRAVPTRRLEAR